MLLNTKRENIREGEGLKKDEFKNLLETIEPI